MTQTTGEVLVLKLPIPLDAMATVQEFVERVYGSGETRLRMDGECMRIVAPEDGWGPRARGRGRLPSASNDALKLRYVSLKEGTAQITVEDAESTVLFITEIAKQWFDSIGGVNYVETKLATAGADEPEFVFTMQRASGMTPHELRQSAEARVVELEAELKLLRGGE
ncbi:hypothetical protein [Leucobacter musarum]|uniref:hypothetical protein n=1 Tax=Leucobacter musarum TaxID=1930747 RepID=UPI0006A7F12B|nr:hypothetical protein [Leucobacter musarum]